MEYVLMWIAELHLHEGCRMTLQHRWVCWLSRRSQHLSSLIDITKNADADAPRNLLTNGIKQEEAGLRDSSCNSTSGKGNLPCRRLDGRRPGPVPFSLRRVGQLGAMGGRREVPAAVCRERVWR